MKAVHQSFRLRYNVPGEEVCGRFLLCDESLPLWACILILCLLSQWFLGMVCDEDEVGTYDCFKYWDHAQSVMGNQMLTKQCSSLW